VRRMTPPRRYGQLNQIDWDLERFDASSFYLQPVWPDGSLVAPDSPTVITGDLLLTHIESGLTNTSAVWNGSVWLLGWAAAIPDVATFQLAKNNPAWRGPNGEYLTPKTWWEKGHVPTGQNSDVLEGTAALQITTFPWINGGGQLAVKSLACIVRLFDNTSPIGLDIDGANITATWATPVVSGELFHFLGGLGIFLNSELGDVTDVTVAAV
jgi:hypothetical protein